jgi:hypothetical protein
MLAYRHGVVARLVEPSGYEGREVGVDEESHAR